MSADEQKLRAAQEAVKLVESGMTVGLGTGSTAAKFIDLLGARVKDGLDVVCVATSRASELQAANLGIELSTLDEVPFLDITVDGADELDRDLRLIKGGGGALMREKIVAMASERMIVIADESKLVERLGAFPLPIEVDRFGLRSTIEMVTALSEELGLTYDIEVREREDGQFFTTDGGHCILDCAFKVILEPEELSDSLAMIPGVIESGLFIGIAEQAIIGVPGGVEIIDATFDDEGVA